MVKNSLFLKHTAKTANIGNVNGAAKLKIHVDDISIPLKIFFFKDIVLSF